MRAREGVRDISKAPGTAQGRPAEGGPGANFISKSDFSVGRDLLDQICVHGG